MSDLKKAQSSTIEKKCFEKVHTVYMELLSTFPSRIRYFSLVSGTRIEKK